MCSKCIIYFEAWAPVFVEDGAIVSWHNGTTASLSLWSGTCLEIIESSSPNEAKSLSIVNVH